MSIRITPEVHVFLLKGDEVLLLQRKNTGYEDGSYCVISGHVDGDEPATTAAIREAEEEVGVIIEASSITCSHVLHLRADDVRGERVAFFFSCREWQGEPANKELHKCDHVAWYPVTELPENTISYIKHALIESAAKSYSEFGWPNP